MWISATSESLVWDLVTPPIGSDGRSVVNVSFNDLGVIGIGNGNMKVTGDIIIVGYTYT